MARPLRIEFPGALSHVTSIRPLKLASNYSGLPRWKSTWVRQMFPPLTRLRPKGAKPSVLEGNGLDFHQVIRMSQAGELNGCAGDGLGIEILLPDLRNGPQLLADVRQIDVDLHHAVEACSRPLPENSNPPSGPISGGGVNMPIGAGFSFHHDSVKGGEHNRLILHQKREPLCKILMIYLGNPGYCVSSGKGSVRRVYRRGGQIRIFCTAGWWSLSLPGLVVPYLLDFVSRGHLAEISPDIV